MLRLLVIGSQKINFYELFKGSDIDGLKVVVEQCAWDGSPFQWIITS
jgi:hypothetical protein